MNQTVQPPGTVVDLGQGVKAKFPGQYDDVPDADLGRAFQAKYPGQYDDFQDVNGSTSAVPGMEKLGGIPPPAGQAPKINMQSPTLASAGGVAAGVATGFGKGAASTMFHGGDLIRRATGMPRVINNPEVQAGITPSKTAETVGSGIEQAAEYLIPGSAEEAGAKAIAGAAGGGGMARALGRAIASAVGAGAVAGVQSGGDPRAMRNAALAAGGTSAALSGVAAMLPTKQGLATRLYQSALKPSTAMDQAERQAIINTGLREGITLDPNVVETVQQRISGLNSQISNEIAQRTAQGATVDPEAVAAYTDRSAARAAQQVNPDADVSAVNSAKQEFLRNQSTEAPYTKIRPGTDDATGTMVPEGQGVTQVPQAIPLSQAQKLKQGTYAKLKDSYAEQGSFSREAQKDLARGLKDQIVQAFPELSALNSRESSLLALESSLQRFVGRSGNSNLIGLGTPLTAVAAHAAGGPVLPLTMLKAALEMPEVKSRLAIALAKSAANPGVVSKAAGAAVNTAPAAAGYLGGQSRKQTSVPAPGQ